MTMRHSMHFVPMRLVDKFLGQQMVKVLYYYYCYVIRIIFKLHHELNVFGSWRYHLSRHVYLLGLVKFMLFLNAC